jgi:hypothetical protein
MNIDERKEKINRKNVMGINVTERAEGSIINLRQAEF